MKKLISILVCCVLLVSCNMGMDEYSFHYIKINGKTGIDWEANGIKVNDNINNFDCFDDIMEFKYYNSDGNLSAITKFDSAFSVSDNGSNNESLKTIDFNHISVSTYKNSDLIKKIEISTSDTIRGSYEILYLIKTAFGSCDNSKISTRGSQSWPYSYSIYYKDKIDGVNFTLKYYESKKFHLSHEYGTPSLSIIYEGM